jgi:NaMN:DMB phosphoribosyltransferase
MIAPGRLGHSTIVATIDIYSGVTEQMREDAAVKLDAATALRSFGYSLGYSAEMGTAELL